MIRHIRAFVPVVTLVSTAAIVACTTYVHAENADWTLVCRQMQTGAQTIQTSDFKQVVLVCDVVTHDSALKSIGSVKSTGTNDSPLPFNASTGNRLVPSWQEQWPIIDPGFNTP